ncbi:hypothetical protein VOLCADRAFT_121227 [Volvox carteri f. nagariensis]|uniref:Uncharacterized protein n=1 Tax=Volvox carteri f. nagariensis TaxID=3068 RepID=D8U5H4_VOLCA|nr:uncharacterized protein VOLCADRAFT_121227 [Volvox carteri f. nagariensis]EFJ44920.1 hypothetical protein VOLCADRAFT_121227 [Volvox carteri f. nagariensis]|eukprot:XP_002953891.1 hypothetical protein VOLCADRAFT_121227 [Volvox carteri f. nagariensis]
MSTFAGVHEGAEVAALPAKSQIEYLISQTSPSLLRPMAFFVSWNGVLTLAYSGFPPALMYLKQSLNDTVEGLPAEYSGSKWPKTSLGALHDKARLTPEQLDRLNAICREESAKLVQDSDEQAVLVDKLTVVFYQCRCLERRMLEHTIMMRNGQPLDARPPDPSEQERVRGVVSEADSPDYWFLASKDGSRESHYRNSYLGVTLVHDLEAFRRGKGRQLAQPALGAAQPVNFGSALPGIIQAFRSRVDLELPGLYCWFRDDSLHSTVRSLMG